jgi:prepilin peptidase CpaA
MHNMTIQPSPIATTCLVAFVIMVAVSDMRSRRIPNWLTVGAVSVGLVTSVMVGGPSAILGSLAGLAVGLAVFLPFYLARGFSAGDVKAMAAIGAFVGPKGALLAGAWILLVGSIGGIALLIRLGGPAAVRALRDRWLARVCILVATGAAPGIEPPAADPARHRFPYGVAIAAGTVTSLIWS